MNVRVASAASLISSLVVSCGGGAPPKDALLAASSDALHSGQSCSGTVSGDVNTNLIVRSGATCTATGASIHGSVFVEAGALGFVGDGLKISGRVDIRDVAAGPYHLAGSILGGGITATNMGPGTTLEICGNIIPGRVAITGNHGSANLGKSANPLCGGDLIHDAVAILGNAGSVKLDFESVKENVTVTGGTAGGTTTVVNSKIEDDFLCSGNATPTLVAGNTVGGNNTCGSVAPSPPNPPACTTGADLETGDHYVVCASDATSAWVSAANFGHYHAQQICQTLGYSTLGVFGGTCGNTCGFCEAPTSCSATGNQHFDGNGKCGSDAFGQILCFTVTWKCVL